MALQPHGRKIPILGAREFIGNAYNQNSAGWHLETGWLKAAAADTNLYIGVISRDTKTYTSSGVKLQIGVMYP